MKNINSFLNRNIQQRTSYQSYVIVVVVLIASLSSCKEYPEREPQLEIKGETSWYKGTVEEKQYLLNTFKSSTGVHTISWPPEELRRIVDISVDITGSGYSREVLFQDHRISLAEYNLRKLREYLLDNSILQPGDRIFVRLFGAKPGGQDIDVDIYNKIDYPGLRVDMQTTVFDKHFHDVEIVSSKVTSDPDANLENIVTSVFTCNSQNLI